MINFDDPDRDVHKVKCFKCGCKIKTLNVLLSTCKCKNTFCSKHIFAGLKDNNTSHVCPYDYIGDAQDALKKLNPIIATNVHRSNMADFM